MTPKYEYSYPEDQCCFNEKSRKPDLGPETPIFIFRTDRKIQKQSWEISNKYRKKQKHRENKNPGISGYPQLLSILSHFFRNVQNDNNDFERL